ncbi:tetratricopeptide repeat-containing glycosyltransferase family 2 protein [Clostridium sp. 'White wine YQ']|uniref:tetratricopeptide repeat-containing glycosyltransferase family 2 protein n=1 Tax=Clostridium sp. 'White wine YQ' TaxID=3027474 RepID=UPI002366B28C|nr:glycosyltransferase [Clostridium sp. 'White wine YQ']MDD7795328.1 glycosyltransferase [Clostridium sp. 'White wine YQ']
MSNEVSLCMIVKDEEEYLATCLESVKDIVDEVIVVDTGSSDRTVAIAKNFNAKIHYYKWNNSFSDARNESLKYATKDWILILDADEELSNDSIEVLKKLLESSLNEDTIYFFETLSYYGDSIDKTSISINLNPRLFKNNQGTHYEGEIHNQLIYSEKKYGVMCRDIKVYHYGYLNKSIYSKNKKDRNITLLEEQIRKDPNNAFAHFNLGTEYARLDDSEKALQHYYKSYEKFDPRKGYSYLLIFRIAFENCKIKDYETTLKFINIGIEHYPKFTELYFLRSLVYKDMNMPIKQIRELEKCVELGEAPIQYRCILGVGDFKAYYELGNVYFNLKDYETAYNYYEKAINVDFISPIYSIGFILKNKNTPVDEFKKILEKHLDNYTEADKVMAELFYSQGLYKTALEYIIKYEQTGVFTDDMIILKARCLVRTGAFEECINMENMNGKSDTYVYFLVHKVLSSILTNNYEKALSLINSVNYETLSDYNKKFIKVYSQCLNIFKGEEASEISNDENEKESLEMILEICEVLLINDRYEELKKAVNLLNLISNKVALLELGKLYYNQGFVELGKKEILRSIKEFEVYDRVGLDMLMS